jgi:hypothetical protein
LDVFGAGWKPLFGVVGDRQTVTVFEEFPAKTAFNRLNVDPLPAKGALFRCFHSCRPHNQFSLLFSVKEAHLL